MLKMLNPQSVIDISNESFVCLKKLVDELRVCGVGEYIQLPQIAVMGDTSSGKSSLMSFISGIEFPSAVELTTRCPTQILLQNFKTFHASIEVSGIDIPQTVVETVNQLKIKSLNDIPIVIQQSMEILCQGKQFSENSIVINVKGPLCPNLTLIDLPGLIRNVKDGEDKKSIDFVKNLVKKYLVQQRTIILAVVPANVDMHNTEIMQYAAEVDHDGYRTICVITKPDLVDIGAEKGVINLLMNQEKYFRLGYHVVRCRGNQDLKNKLSIVDALTREEIWFSEKEPWNHVPNNLKGTRRLKEKLAIILKEKLVDTLPEILKEIDMEIANCKSQLDSFGPELTNISKRRQVFTLTIKNIVELMISGLKGQYSHTFFQNNLPNRKLFASIYSELVRFQEMVERTRVPCLGDLTTGDAVECFTINQDFKGQSWKKGFVVKCNQDEITVFVPEYKRNYELTMDKIRVETGEIKALLSLNRGLHLSILPNYTVFENLYLCKIEDWSGFGKKLHSRCVQLVEEYWKEICEYSVSFPSVRHFIYSRGIIYIEEASKKLDERMNEIFKVEQKPYTMNDTMFSELIKLRMAPIKSSLRALATKRDLIDVNSVIQLLEDSMENMEVIEISTALAAYIKISKKRYVDEIAKSIRSDFFQNIEDRLPELLFASDDELSHCMQEKTLIIQKRRDITERLNTLLRGRHKIIELKLE